MLINLSNHPYSKWSPEQLSAAKQYGEIVDLPFPAIDPALSETDVQFLANEYQEKILKLPNQNNELLTVHIMGELTFCFALITKLKKAGIHCIASTTLRNTIEEAGVKISKFDFVQFRSY